MKILSFSWVEVLVIFYTVHVIKYVVNTSNSQCLGGSTGNIVNMYNNIISNTIVNAAFNISYRL
jgi:hypothetical protein